MEGLFERIYPLSPVFPPPTQPRLRREGEEALMCPELETGTERGIYPIGACLLSARVCVEKRVRQTDRLELAFQSTDPLPYPLSHSHLVCVSV
jgi:hypothetical protein